MSLVRANRFIDNTRFHIASAPICRTSIICNWSLTTIDEYKTIVVPLSELVEAITKFVHPAIRITDKFGVIRHFDRNGRFGHFDRAHAKCATVRQCLNKLRRSFLFGIVHSALLWRPHWWSSAATATLLWIDFRNANQKHGVSLKVAYHCWKRQLP